MKILVADNLFTEINFTENFSQKATILHFKAKISVNNSFRRCPRYFVNVSNKIDRIVVKNAF